MPPRKQFIILKCCFVSIDSTCSDQSHTSKITFTFYPKYRELQTTHKILAAVLFTTLKAYRLLPSSLWTYLINLFHVAFLSLNKHAKDEGYPFLKHTKIKMSTTILVGLSVLFTSLKVPLTGSGRYLINLLHFVSLSYTSHT